uniref:DUF4794 domain-containing protein n=1 Tax=Pectinophora gossypiella TaxID=13191 RepID=A0A1E1WQU0_PECGO
MKVLALVILAVIASSSALGSGPYLPSGWRPTGPAFYLPNEVQKPAAIPLKDVPVQEESSGSEALREYGPPKVEVTQAVQEVSQDITQQALPDPVTEQAFLVIQAKFNEEEAAQVNQEAISEQIQAVEETATEFQNTAQEQTTQSEELIQGRSLDVETQTESSLAVQEEESTEKLAEITQQENAEVTQNLEVSQENVEVAQENVQVAQENVEITQNEEVTQQYEAAQQETENANSNIVAVEQREEVAEVKAVEEGVKNIAEALVNLENEIKAQQVQAVQEVTEAKTVQESSGSVPQAPEGFLEYGPPGFTEYGPPKGDLRTVTNEETNEVRRRRFSPKFKSLKAKH